MSPNQRLLLLTLLPESPLPDSAVDRLLGLLHASRESKGTATSSCPFPSLFKLETLYVLASRIAKVVGKLHHACFQTFFIFNVYVCVEASEHLQMSLGCHPEFSL